MSGPRSAPVLGRRALTVGLLSVPTLPVLLAGCDDDDGVDLPGLPDLGPDPDEPLLEAALQAERALVDLATRTARRHRALRRTLAPTRAVHAAHVTLLEEAAGDADAGDGAAGGRVAGTPAAALATLARREKALAATHVEQAMKAQSGPFARLMAVLAAAAMQQSVALTDATAGLYGGRS